VTIHTTRIQLKNGTTATIELTSKQVQKLIERGYTFDIINSYDISDEDYNSIAIKNT
jgi:hypothetical protein